MSCWHQQYQQGPSPTLHWARLDKGQYFFLLYQPALHPAFEYRAFAR